MTQSLATHPSINHDDLLRAARDGDIGAFHTLWDAHLSSFTRMANALCWNDEGCEDALSTAFERTWTAMSNGCGPTENFGGYVCRAIINLINAERRRDSHFDYSAEVTAAADAAASRSDLWVIEGVIERRMMTEAMELLPERQAHALRLSGMGHSNTEVGVKLGVSTENAAQIIRRARVELRRLFLQQAS